MSDAQQEQSVGDIIEAWFREHFADSPVSRDTELWNLVHAAKEDLKARFARPAAHWQD